MRIISLGIIFIILSLLARSQPDSLIYIAAQVNNVQSKAHHAEYEDLTLNIPQKNFWPQDSCIFHYRITTKEKGVLPIEIEEDIDFTEIKSIIPSPVSGITGSIKITFRNGQDIHFYYRDENADGGKLMNALLDLIRLIHKERGMDSESSFNDWDHLVTKRNTYKSVSEFISKHPDSFLTEFAVLILNSKYRLSQ